MWILVMRPWTFYLISITFFICKMTILASKIQCVYSMWYLAQRHCICICMYCLFIRINVVTLKDSSADWGVHADPVPWSEATGNFHSRTLWYSLKLILFLTMTSFVNYCCVCQLYMSALPSVFHKIFYRTKKQNKNHWDKVSSVSKGTDVKNRSTCNELVYKL